MNEQQTLLNRLQVCDFILQEAALFLDTHPDNSDALAYYQKYLALRQKALEDYTAQYGPVERTLLPESDRWDWVDNPWPWERGQ